MFTEKKTLMIALVAALFVVGFAYTSSAFMGGNSPFTYTGKIVALDIPNRTMTVAGDHDRIIFNLDKDAAVTRCDAVVSPYDLKIGDEITVAYHETSGGNFVAGDIKLLWEDMGMKRC